MTARVSRRRARMIRANLDEQAEARRNRERRKRVEQSGRGRLKSVEALPRFGEVRDAGL